jgi:hypothetical protein
VSRPVNSGVDHYRALVAEYHELHIGTLWLEEVRAAVRTVVSSYPPAVYAETGIWSEDALEDVVSDVTVRQLVEDGQIDYIVATARTLRDARGLLRQNAKWTIARRRQRTVVDNLLDRCRELRGRLAASEPEPQPRGGMPSRSATDDELRSAARRVAQLPRVSVRGGDRAPTVFTGEVLEQVMAVVADCLPGGYGDRELGRIFEQVLTPHLPSGLVIHGGAYDEPDVSLSPEEALLVAETVMRVESALSDEQRVMYAMKLRGDADSAIAQHLRLSRPTIAARRKDAGDILSQHLIDLPQRLQDAAVMDLAHRLLPLAPTSAEDLPDQPGGAT